MSSINVTNIKHPSSASNNIVLDSSGRALIGVSSANANGGILQLSSGITFPATQVLSTDPNTLDDYEEGTWTPTVIGTSSAGTANYSFQTGRYTKIGRLVYVESYLSWSSGTGTGDLRVAGLPFTSANSSTYPSFYIGYTNNLALTANNLATAYADNNATTIYIDQYPVGGGGGNRVPYDANASLIISGSYTV